MLDADAPEAATAPRLRLPSAPLALGGVLAVGFVLRARMLAIPLGRDEGVYATIGWSLLRGVPLYTGPVDLQMPGLWLVYAAVMALFGANSTGVHVGLLVVNLVSTGLVYLLGRRLIDPVGGVVAASAFAALSLSERMLGFTANAEHFILVFALGGSLLLLRALESGRPRDFFLAGVLASFALLVKQQGVFLTAFVGAYAVYGVVREQRGLGRAQLAKLALLVAGVAAPLSALALWLVMSGVFSEFFFWAFRYSATYGAGKSLGEVVESLETIALPIAPDVAGFVALSLVGLFAGVVDARTGRRDRARTVFLVLFSGAAALAILPGLNFRHHYFLLATPAVALLAAAGVSAVLRWTGCAGRRSAGLVAAAITGLALVQWAIPQRDYLFVSAPDDIARRVYRKNPMVELEQLGSYIESRTAPDDRLLVLGSEPQLYLYSRRLPATQLVVMYPMMWAPPEMALELQRRTIREAEAAAPRYLVFVVSSNSWSKRDRTPTLILEWAKAFATRHYRTVARVDVDYPGPSRFRWGEAATSTDPATSSYIWLLERIPDAASG